MARALELYPDRLFPVEPVTRAIARAQLVAEHRLADRDAADRAPASTSGRVRRADRIDQPLFAAQAA